MARRAKPWFWEARNTWCVYIRGEKHLLGPDKEQAERQFHALMAKRPEERAVHLDDDAVAIILDDFYEWAKEKRAKRTADRYWDFLQDFVTSCGTLHVSELSPKHVTKWLAKKTAWNSTTKFNALTALQRAFNWAVKNRGLRFNPIHGMEKDKPKTRTVVVAPDEFERILTLVRDQPFKDLLILSFDCGTRPFEIKRLEARHVELAKQRAVIPADEAKKNIPRAVYFATPRSLAVIKRLMKERPLGPLLLNRKGNVWNGGSVKCRFARLEKKLGRRLTHYALRHSYITNKLKAGVDSHVVAALSGHRSSKMIDQVYSHIADDHDFMLAQAKRRSTKKSS